MLGTAKRFVVRHLGLYETNDLIVTLKQLRRESRDTAGKK